MKRLLITIAVCLFPFTVHAQSFAGATRFTTALGNTSGTAPTNDTSAYASGDLIGPLLVFRNAVRSSNCSGLVVSVNVTDKSKQAVDLALVLFSSQPTATTFTDNGAFAPATADLPKIVGTVLLASSTTHFAFSANSEHFIGSLAIPIKANNSSAGCQGDLYGALVSYGTPTFAGTTDLSTTIAVSLD